MKTRFILVSGICIVMCLTMWAHEFWIQPSRTRVRVGDRVSLYTMVGENFTGENWKGKGNRVNFYKHFSKDADRDLLLSIGPGESNVNLTDFIPHTEGTHMLAFSTDFATIELSSEDFQAYLKEDGLKDALEYRNANNLYLEPGREKYKRCAKVLLQAGVSTDQTYKRKAGLDLEIIPEDNPYDYDFEKGIKFKVLYEDNPLPDALVKWWHKDNNVVEKDEQFTDNRGEVTFHAQKPGLYMISVVHMIRLTNNPAADWQSTWSTLVFGNDY